VSHLPIVHEFLGSIYAYVHCSELIDRMSKKNFQTSLHHYGQKDYFHCIQNCVFQIESILRGLSEKIGILNLYHDEQKTVPKGLEHLINQIKIHEKQVISEKLIYYIEWLLCNSTEFMTENIRNKIAHGIDNVEQFRTVYTKWNALALILIFLCLSKYKI